jgi:hypothetical protein
VGLNLVFQVLGGLEQRGFKHVVSGLGMQGRAMNQQRRLSGMAGGPGVRAGSWNLQPDLDAEGRFGFPLVFERHVSRGDRRQAVQMHELFLHLAVPGGLGGETEIVKGDFYIRSNPGLQWHLVYAGRMARLDCIERV